MQELNNYSDSELLLLFREGKGIDSALRYAYREYFEMLSIYVRQHSGTLEDSEDVFQEVIVTFINLVQQDKFRGESSIKTFLFALNRNIWLNELKKRTRSQVREIKFETAKEKQEMDISHYISAREGRQQVIATINRLDEVCREILLAFYYENLPMKQILDRLNYENEQVVRNKKYKCLKKLEELLHKDPVLTKNLKAVLHYE
jgi:RNA polymerase sigma factor (sigma-70 family)